MNQIEKFSAMPAWSLLSLEGRRYVTQVLNSPPHRAPGASALVNVCGGYASSKFPFLVEYESAGCEKPYVLLSVLDDEVVALRAQPTALVLEAYDKLGRRRPVHYTPDYLEVRNDRFWLVEAKTEADLIELSAKSQDWVRGEDGWRYLPAEAAAESLGLGFKIFCPEQYPRAFLVNTQFFASVTKDDLLVESPGVLAQAKRALSDRPLSLEVLCQQVPKITGGFVFQAILAGQLFGDINAQHFDAAFLVYGSAIALERARERCRRISDRAPGPLEARLLSASEKEISAALEKSKIYDERREAKIEKTSSERRFAGRIKAAENEGAPKLAAFVPNFKGRGGNASQLSEECALLVVKLAKEYLKGGGPPVATRIYAYYTAAAQEMGVYVVSRETHRKILSRASPVREQPSTLAVSAHSTLPSRAQAAATLTPDCRSRESAAILTAFSRI